MWRLLKTAAITILVSLLLFDGYYKIRSYFSSSLTNENHYENVNYYWRYVPNSQFSIKNEDNEDVMIRSDDWGFRNEEKFKKYDVLLLGDSFINAANTPFAKSYASQLNKITEMTVYNAGMNGTGTCHQAYILSDYLDKINPKWVILHFYLGNDFHDNYFGPSLEGLKNRLLHHLNANLNEEAKTDLIKSQKADVFWGDTLRIIKNFLTKHSRSFKFLYEKVFMGLRYSVNSDMAYYNRSEIKIMAFNLKSSEMDQDGMRMMNNTKEAFEWILRIIENHNDNQSQFQKTRLVVVGIPSKAQVSLSAREISEMASDKSSTAFFLKHKSQVNYDRPDMILSSLCHQLKIPYYSLLKDFREHITERLFYDFDSHWHARGQALAAERVGQWIKQGGYSLGSNVTNSVLH